MWSLLLQEVFMTVYVVIERPSGMIHGIFRYLMAAELRKEVVLNRMLEMVKAGSRVEGNRILVPKHGFVHVEEHDVSQEA